MKKIQYMKNVVITIPSPEESVAEYCSIDGEIFYVFPFDLKIGRKTHWLKKAFDENIDKWDIYNAVKKNPVLLFMD